LKLVKQIHDKITPKIDKQGENPVKKIKTSVKTMNAIVVMPGIRE